MYHKRKFALALSLIAILALTACGGDGGSDAPFAPAATAEGAYGGTLSGSTSDTFSLLVLEDGEYWTLYGTQFSGVMYVAGFIQGTGTSSNGTFTSSNGRDFGFTPAIPATVNATYNAATPSIAGTVTEAAGTVNFSGGAMPGSLYNYNTPASLPAVVGAWTLTTLSGERLALNVSASGAFSAAASSGCNFSGTVSPRPSGKNVFNVALRFGLAPCALAGQTATGIAVTYPLATGGNELTIAAIDGTRNYGEAAFGVR